MWHPEARTRDYLLCYCALFCSLCSNTNTTMLPFIYRNRMKMPAYKRAVICDSFFRNQFRRFFLDSYSLRPDEARGQQLLLLLLSASLCWCSAAVFSPSSSALCPPPLRKEIKRANARPDLYPGTRDLAPASSQETLSSLLGPAAALSRIAAVQQYNCSSNGKRGGISDRTNIFPSAIRSSKRRTPQTPQCMQQP